MSYFRSLSAALMSAALSFCLVTAGCGTSAVGIDDCRDIEQARCRAGKTCGIIDDVPACERYYRDHCLHGLATKASAGAVAACVGVIEAAGQCAKDSPKTLLADCDDDDLNREPHASTTKVCDVVQHPERATQCLFLLDEPPAENGGATGSGGEPADDSSDAAGGGGAATTPE